MPSHTLTQFLTEGSYKDIVLDEERIVNSKGYIVHRFTEAQGSFSLSLLTIYAVAEWICNRDTIYNMVADGSLRLRSEGNLKVARSSVMSCLESVRVGLVNCLVN